MSDQPLDPIHENDKEDNIPFFPDYILDEAIAWYIALALLVALASLFPAGLEEEATPLSTPAHVKPEWYFLFFYQLLKIVPRIMGIVISGVGIVGLFLLPFIDRSPARHPRTRGKSIALAVAILIVIVLLSIWGRLS